MERLGVIHDGGVWERREQRQDVGPPLQASAGDLSDDERVHPDFTVTQAPSKGVVAVTEVVDPDRRVDEHRLSGGASGAGAGWREAPSRSRRARPTAWHSPAQ